MGWLEPQGVDEEDRLDRREAAQVVRRALGHLRPYRLEIVLGCLVMAGATACLVAPPLLFALVVDRLTAAVAHPATRHHAGAYIDRVAILLVVLAVAAWVLARAQIIVVTRVGEKFLRDIRRRAFDHLLGMSLGFFDSEQTGRLVSRLTSDIDTMEDLVQQGLVVFVTNGLVFLFTLGAMVYLSWELTL
ncbi:MAG TPA: ABC transporter transmembrane domain-containing protein, partial [Acidimicrobiales bacterium]